MGHRPMIISRLTRATALTRGTDDGIPTVSWGCERSDIGSKRLLAVELLSAPNRPEPITRVLVWLGAAGGGGGGGGK